MANLDAIRNFRRNETETETDAMLRFAHEAGRTEIYNVKFGDGGWYFWEGNPEASHAWFENRSFTRSVNRFVDAVSDFKLTDDEVDEIVRSISYERHVGVPGATQTIGKIQQPVTVGWLEFDDEAFED